MGLEGGVRGTVGRMPACRGKEVVLGPGGEGAQAAISQPGSNWKLGFLDECPTMVTGQQQRLLKYFQSTCEKPKQSIPSALGTGIGQSLGKSFWDALCIKLLLLVLWQNSQARLLKGGEICFHSCLGKCQYTVDGKA